MQRRQFISMILNIQGIYRSLQSFYLMSACSYNQEIKWFRQTVLFDLFHKLIEMPYLCYEVTLGNYKVSFSWVLSVAKFLHKI